MKIFITGGSGFVGSNLTRDLTDRGHQVSILTRQAKSKANLPSGATYVIGDPNAPGPWQQEISGHNLIINLAGASIFTRWTTENKQKIRDSRINTTHHLVDALEMAASENRPKTLLSTSAVGYYGDHGDELLTEETAAGNDFLARVAQTWEAEAERATNLGLRVVCCRFGIVLGKKGGALSKMLPLFRFGLGSPLGHGRQFFPWIHEKDLARIFTFLVENPEIKGPVNCVSPNQVTNAELSQALASQLGKKVFPINVPAFALKTIMGEMASILLSGQRVAPTQLDNAGFQFAFTELSSALKDILG